MEIQKRNVLDHLEGAKLLGKVMATSGMFGIKSEAQGVILALTCASENITPMQFSRKYHIIDGKPTMRSDAMLAEFCKSGGSHVIKSYTAQKVEIVFTWRKQETSWSWDMSKAKRAGLSEKANWKKYPEAMLFSRCVSEALKRICPELFHGLYTPEEIQDTKTVSVTVLDTPEKNKTHAPIIPNKQSEIAPVDYSVTPAKIKLVSVRTGLEKTFVSGSEWSSIPRDFLKAALETAKNPNYKAEIEKAISARRKDALLGNQYGNGDEPLDLDEMVSKFRKARKHENKVAWCDKILDHLDNDGVPSKEVSRYFSLLSEMDDYASSPTLLRDLTQLCFDLMSDDVVDTKEQKEEKTDE